MEQNNKGFGIRLKEKRRQRGYSTEEFAGMLDISVSYIALLERGERKPSYALLLKIAAFLGASLDELIFGNASDEAPESNQITLNENEIAELRRDTRWMSIDRETALGLAVGRVIKKFNFDDNQLSYISAALYCAAHKICDRVNRDAE